jgi:hypothetical protein
MAGLAFDETLLRPFKHDPRDTVAFASFAFAESTDSASAPSFGEAYRSYIDDPTRGWTVNTRGAYETSRKLAVAVLGEELPLASISRAHCRDLLDVLRFLRG